jgi:1-deoxy-D-xylulose 5-phosphate reductoisomerase
VFLHARGQNGVQFSQRLDESWRKIIVSNADCFGDPQVVSPMAKVIEPRQAFESLIAAAHAATTFANDQYSNKPSTAYAEAATNALKAATEALQAAKELNGSAFLEKSPG